MYCLLIFFFFWSIIGGWSYFVKKVAFGEYFGSFFGYITFLTFNNTQLSMLIEKKILVHRFSFLLVIDL